MNFEVLDRGNGQILLRGRFNEKTAADAMVAGQKLFTKYSDISVDLAEVDCANTVCLAMLVEWSMWAHAFDKKIVYENVPVTLMAIAKVHYVDQLLRFDSE